jgi:6,7-dimethyl-8-ribityllumazine synthase
MNVIEGNLSLNGDEKIAIISSRFNHIITDRLIEGAEDAVARHGGDSKSVDLVLVPGAFEIPFALNRLIESGKYDGICCIGAVIRGSTPHFDYIAAEVTKGVANIGMKSKTAVTYGVLTTDTIEQAIERAGSKAGNKGFEAMTGLIEMMSLYKKIG